MFGFCYYRITRYVLVLDKWQSIPFLYISFCPLVNQFACLFNMLVASNMITRYVLVLIKWECISFLYTSFSPLANQFAYLLLYQLLVTCICMLFVFQSADLSLSCNRWPCFSSYQDYVMITVIFSFSFSSLTQHQTLAQAEVNYLYMPKQH